VKLSKEIKAPKLKPQIFVVSGAFLIFALLFLIGSKKFSETPKFTEMDARVQLGISYVQGGGAPMIGIGMLKDVLKEDPNNKFAIWTLGTFSQKSGQHDKAIQRFEDLLNIETEKDERVNVYTALEFSLISTNQVNRALLLHEKMMSEFAADTTLVSMIQERNNEIRNRFINVKKD
jgi:hypothetical protein